MPQRELHINVLERGHICCTVVRRLDPIGSSSSSAKCLRSSDVEEQGRRQQTSLWTSHRPCLSEGKHACVLYERGVTVPANQCLLGRRWGRCTSSHRPTHDRSLIAPRLTQRDPVCGAGTPMQTVMLMCSCRRCFARAAARGSHRSAAATASHRATPTRLRGHGGMSPLYHRHPTRHRSRALHGIRGAVTPTRPRRSSFVQA